MPSHFAVSLIERPSTEIAANDGALAGRERRQRTTNLPVADGFGCGLGKSFGDLANLDLHPAPTAAKGVNEFVFARSHRAMA